MYLQVKSVQRIAFLVSMNLVSLLSGCHNDPSEDSTSRQESASAVMPASVKTAATIFSANEVLDQGLTPAQQKQWFELSQGSRMLPVAWFKALEQPDSTAPFLADDFWEGLGFPVYDLQTQAEPIRLARGFTIDQQDDSALTVTKIRWKAGQSSNEPWIGPTCAACHTSQINYQGSSFTVLGGQTLADFQILLEKLNLALVQTNQDSAKFDRFAKQVLAAEDTPGNRALLKAALDTFINADHLYGKENDLTALRYGPGRLDAIGHIYEKVAQFTGAGTGANLIPPTYEASDAPTSYPMIWNVPQLDRVQWTGFAPQAKVAGTDLGAIIRNVGEVTGVFADVQTHPLGLGYFSSINIPNLVTLEETLGKIKPPAWPNQAFGVPDQSLVTQGQALFKKNCESCHTMIDRQDLSTPITTTMSKLAPNTRLTGEKPLGTDPWTACNGYQRSTASGNLIGMPQVPGFTVNNQAGLFGPIGYSLDLTAWMQLGIILNQAPVTIATAARSILLGSSWTNIYGELPLNLFIPVAQGLLSVPTPVKQYSADKQTRKAECLQIDHQLIAYKGRPLNGIWASAPYLHNGSVPTLYDLLLPPDQRPKTFYTGSAEFDPVKVGYVTSVGGANTFLLDTQIEGNLNTGHDYDNHLLSDQDRWALVEFMKTL